MMRQAIASTAPGTVRRYDAARWERLELEVFADLQRLADLRAAGRLSAAAHARYLRDTLALLHLVNWGTPRQRAARAARRKVA